MFLRRAADPGWNRIHELPTMGTRLELYSERVEVSDIVRPPIAIFGIWKNGRRRPFDARLLRVPVGQCRHLLSTVLDEVVSELISDDDRRTSLLHTGQAAICGHAQDGGKTDGPHVAVAALPSVSGPYPDGRIRRLAVVGFGCIESEKRRLFDAIVARLHDRELIDEGEETGLVLRREADTGSQFLLTGVAAEWESVTPMILDRPEFRRKEWEQAGHASRRRAARAGDPTAAIELEQSLAVRREDLVREAFERVAASQVSQIELSRAPLRAGMHPAGQYRTSGYLQASPRFHVRVRFCEPVAGPLLAGRGRYVGFGLFRPIQ